jgi:hypothetical protein
MNCNELQENARLSHYLVKRPRALQWFYRDRLCKESEEERQAGRFELFLDLLCTSLSHSSTLYTGPKTERERERECVD